MSVISPDCRVSCYPSGNEMVGRPSGLETDHGWSGEILGGDGIVLASAKSLPLDLGICHDWNSAYCAPWPGLCISH